MTNHLSDEQFTRYLSGDEDSAARLHLEQCATCRADAQRLLAIVGESRAKVERGYDRHPSFWALQRNQVRDALAVQRPRPPAWAIASVLAVLVFLSMFMFQGQKSRFNLDKEAAAQPPAAVSDDALLSAVDATLAQDVPSALVPVQRLAYEREQAERDRAGRN